MGVFVVTSGGILVKEMSEPINRKRFVNSCISMLCPSEIICDQYPAGLTIDYFIDSLSVTVARVHTREGKVDI